jgi:hypothetical protein
MRCPRCQHDNETGAKFCEQSAAPLTRTCGYCGRQLSPTARFCPECGHPTGVAPEASPDAPVASPARYTPKHLADALGMRPLPAHCHGSLGKLYRHAGEREDAKTHLVTAMTMYREMDMRFWLDQLAEE